MMKKILAAAIVSAFAAPAFAATANVDIYGTIHMSIDSLNDGSDRGTNVSTNASNIGFKGSEDLGGGLSAIWQAETLINQAGGTALFGGQRDTFLGLSSKTMGTLRVGFFDTPTKQLSRGLDFFNNEIGDSRNLLRSNAISGVSGNAWEERFNNGIRYDTPDFSGFTASVHYATQTLAGVADNNDLDAYSLGANYKNGPFFVGVAYQLNNVTTTTDETSWRVGGSFTMADFKVNALYHKAEDQRGVAGADRAIWGLGAGYKLGNGLIKAQYYKANDEKVTVGDSAAKMFAVGYDYNLSKRTKVYVDYAKTTNKAGASFSMSGGGHDDNLGVQAAGSDPSGVSLGMVHKF